MQYIIIPILALLIAGYYYRRSIPELSKAQRALLTALRAISVALILLLIISPIFYYVRSYTTRPKLIVLRDISESMDLQSAGKAKKELLVPVQNRLEKRYEDAGYEVVKIDFAAGIGKNRSNSLLAPTLAELPKLHKLNDIHAILLSSDGWLRDENLDIVKQLGIPIHVLTDSSRTIMPDLQTLQVKSSAYAYRNEPGLFVAQFISNNADAKAKALLKINGKTVAEKQLDLKADTVKEVEFNHSFAQTGFYSYSIEITNPDIKERSLNNNSYPGAIEVLSEKEKILLISDSPGWDNKFIIDALGTNPRWEIKHISVKDQRLSSNNKALSSISAENPSAIVIINNGNLKASATTIAEIKTLHNRGAGLLYMGLPIADLEDILPLRASNIRSSYQGFLRWTPIAESYPMLSLAASEQRNIPPMDYYYCTAHPNAKVPVTIDNPQTSAAIAILDIPGRRSIGIGFLNLWRWQMQSPGSTYIPMFTQMLTWLSNRSTDGFRAIYNNSYFAGEQINIRLRAEDDTRSTDMKLSPYIKVQNSQGEVIFEDFLAQSKEEFAIAFSPDLAGEYSFEIRDRESGKSSKGKFIVSETSLESRDFDFNLPLLAWIAFESGGKQISDPLTHPILPAVSQTRSIGGEYALYRKWYILLLFIAVFCTELFLRRRWGLL